MKPWVLPTLLFCALAPCFAVLSAQSTGDALSDAEVETLRDAVYLPVTRIDAYEKILDTRERRIENLLAKPRRPGFATEMHDLMEQFGAIVQEFNDNLDDLDSKHRDVRKSLPKLLKATDRWATVLRSPVSEAGFEVSRRLALDSLKDLRESAETMQTQQDTYFREHKDAAQREKERNGQPHAPVVDGPQ